MKFGIMLPHYRQVASAEAIIRFANESENMGYDSVWSTDQIIVPNEDVERFGSIFYECLTVLAFVAGHTSSIRLGSSIIVLPYRNPIYVAKVVSTLDSLSNGRLIVGVGIGGVESEFRQIGASWEARGKQSDEAIRIFKELWTSDDPSFQGEGYCFSQIQFYPKPVQRPHPPLWIGGNTQRALRRVVEFGDVWHPSRANLNLLAKMTPRLFELAERAGRDPQQIGIAVRQPLKIVSHGNSSNNLWPLLGTVSEVIDGVRRFEDAGVDYLVFDTFYGIPELHDETVATILTTMERFATDVLPQFQVS